MTLAACVQAAVRTLVAAGFPPEDARRDVSVIARHVLGWDATMWITRQRDDVPADLLHAIRQGIDRRAAFEPVAYITGQREFYGRSFGVTGDVLIPRPETELLVEQALVFIGTAHARSTSPAVADVGTGSGCIAVTLACERPGLQIAATDVSAAALEVARVNAAAHGVAERITFACVPLLGEMRDLDLVVSNPPYIADSDRETLARDVRDWEPASALFGGTDGLAVVRDLVNAAAAALRSGGGLMIEVGSGQAPAVMALLPAAGFERVRTFEDLAGIGRVVTAFRRDLL